MPGAGRPAQHAGVNRSLAIGFVAACGALLCAPFARAAGLDDAQREAMRERVRLGQLHACVAESLVADAEHPVLVLRNDCDGRVSVTLCLRRESQGEADYYTLLIAPGAEARQQLLMQARQKFSFRFNTCRSDFCTAPRPEC